MQPPLPSQTKIEADSERLSPERALRNKTLWEVHGAERIVFDTTALLAAAEGLSHPR